MAEPPDVHATAVVETTQLGDGIRLHPHVVATGVVEIGAGNGWVWPATQEDSGSDDYGSEIPMGYQQRTVERGWRRHPGPVAT